MRFTFRSKFDLFESIIGVKPHPTLSRQVLPDDYYVEAEDDEQAYGMILDQLSDYIWNYCYAKEDNEDEINNWLGKFDNSLSLWAEQDNGWTIVDDHGIAFYVNGVAFNDSNVVDDVLICRFYDFEIYSLDEMEEE